MAEVVLKDISKVYEGGIKAVDKSNIFIHDKEFVVLVGPSGCGKSTTLRMVAGLEDITSGDLIIDGKRVNDMAPKDRDIAMVFQNYALYPHMSVRDNMAFGLKIRKMDPKLIEERVQEAAQILDIKQLLERKPKALSGGQRQRVAVGRAIVRKPKVFLFDEPLSNLDAKLRVQMRAEISSLHTRLGATMIYVTHDQVEAMTMGDKIVIMKDGLIQQIGTPLGLYNNPKNKFVASFIGSPPMNIFRGHVFEENGNILIREGESVLEPSDRHKSFLKEYLGKDILLGLRPEDLYYSENGKEQNIISAEVEIVEPLGSEIHLYLQTGKNRIIARVEPSHTFDVKEKVKFFVDMKKAHLFDIETENTIAFDEKAALEKSGKRPN